MSEINSADVVHVVSAFVAGRRPDIQAVVEDFGLFRNPPRDEEHFLVVAQVAVVGVPVRKVLPPKSALVSASFRCIMLIWI